MRLSRCIFSFIIFFTLGDVIFCNIKTALLLKISTNLSDQSCTQLFWRDLFMFYYKVEERNLVINECNVWVYPGKTCPSTLVKNLLKREKVLGQRVMLDQIGFLLLIGYLLLTICGNTCHSVALLFKLWGLSVQAVPLHNLAVAPATHQSGSGELNGCSKEIDKEFV